jgi:hypothetical protein
LRHLTKISEIMIAISLLGLSACGGGIVATATVDTASIYTQIASTALALQTQTMLAGPAATNTLQASSTPNASNTPLITNTPLPTGSPLPGTPSATVRALTTPKASAQASCDNMTGIADVTIPDGYIAAPGEVMDKTWKVKNLGPCVWNQDYSLAFAYGGAETNWDHTPPVNLIREVKPGATIDITVTLKAPKVSGTYGAYFKLRNDKGYFFGNVVWISIQVK